MKRDEELWRTNARREMAAVRAYWTAYVRRYGIEYPSGRVDPGDPTAPDPVWPVF